MERAPWIIGGSIVLAAVIVAVALVAVNKDEAPREESGIAEAVIVGAQQRAQDRSAQADLRNAIAAAKTAYTDVDNYATATTTGLSAIEPSLTFVGAGTASAAPDYAVSIAIDDVVAGDSQVWAAARLSASGTCMYIKDVSASGLFGAGNTPGTWYGSDSSSPVCDGTTALTSATALRW